MFNQSELSIAAELLESIRFFNQKGWSPATSTNYSARLSATNYLISRSGVDKSKFAIDDFIVINQEGIVAPFNRPGVKSSAETDIHTYLYRNYPEVHCVLHTHSVLGTTLSQVWEKEGQLVFEGLEILKGLEGNSTHLMSEILPIVPNSQDMSSILSAVEKHLKGNHSLHGFLIAGHGLYTWGKDIAAAKRHIETFEFLFECTQIMRRI